MATLLGVKSPLPKAEKAQKKLPAKWHVDIAELLLSGNLLHSKPLTFDYEVVAKTAEEATAKAKARFIKQKHVNPIVVSVLNVERIR